MNNSILVSAKEEKGFTLVELAIVMVIIGLLIGGILKGQEMIANAQVSATVAQLKGVDAATSTFRDMYDAIPGDITNPAVRLANCTAAPCSTAGNGNSVLTGGPGTVAGENLTYWVHLNAADLVSGVNRSGVAAWGQGLPSAKAGGGITVGYIATGVQPNGRTGRGGHWLNIQSIPATAGSAALSASEAARIDRKMDDGSAATGSVLSTAGTCSSAAGVYTEVNDQQTCNVAIRIQG